MCRLDGLEVQSQFCTKAALGLSNVAALLFEQRHPSADSLPSEQPLSEKNYSPMNLGRVLKT